MSLISLFKNEIKKKTIEQHGRFSFRILAEQMPLENRTKKPKPSENTIRDFFNHNRVTPYTKNELAKYLGYDSYVDFEKKNNKILKLKTALNGKWISYRLNRNRKLYRSKWDFTYDDTTNQLSANKSKSGEDFEGTFEVDEDGLLTGKMKDGTTILFYSAYLDESGPDIMGELKRITLNLSYNQRDVSYYSTEVLYKKTKTISRNGDPVSERIQLYIDKDFTDAKNLDYLAYDYLTKLSDGHRAIVNRKMNTYQHSIFISCPVRSFYLHLTSCQRPV